MNAALFYHSEAYTVAGPKLMGRHAAGAGFLRAYLAFAQGDRWWIQPERREDAADFASRAQAVNRDKPVQVVSPDGLGSLREPGTLYLPGPSLGSHAWQRMMHTAAGWSLCGVTHTTASAGAMDALVELTTAPVEPWDALICTSQAVVAQVRTVFAAQGEYLHRRVGATRLTLPQLPVIPLGVHCDDFEFDAEKRDAARRELGLDSSTVAVLFMGRLSFHAKAHPLAMYQALQQAVKASKQKVVLIECGWHANDAIRDAYAEAARESCPAVRVVTLDGRDPANRAVAWAAGDVFCSLADNIQETFGLTPIEAMAAGMPVVASDWDGYRDTVRDGVDGFLVPTLMPDAGLGGDLARRHALGVDNYDMYCGHTCMLVAVDVAAAADRLGRLLRDPLLRKTMGEAARRRALETYDWRHIIRRYEALWAELAELRRAAPAVARHPVLPPARLDPFRAFAGYPSRRLNGETLLALEPGCAVTDAQATVARWRRLAMVRFAGVVIPSEAEVALILARASDGPMTAAQLVAEVPDKRQAFALRSLAWLAKMGVLRVCN